MSAATTRRTIFEWCDVHKSAEFAHGMCAVAALAPLPVTIKCDFVGTVYVGPLGEEGGDA